MFSRHRPSDQKQLQHGSLLFLLYLICYETTTALQKYKPETHVVSAILSAEGSVYPSSTSAMPGRRLGWAPLPSALSLNYRTKPESCLSVLTRRDWRNLEEFLTASDFIRNSVWPVDGTAAAGKRHTSEGTTSCRIWFDRRHILGLNFKNLVLFSTTLQILQRKAHRAIGLQPPAGVFTSSCTGCC